MNRCIKILACLGVWIIAGISDGSAQEDEKSQSVETQTIDEVTIGSNRWRYVVTNQGSHAFQVSSSNAGGEFPSGSGNDVIFAGGIYVGALKDPGQTNPAFRYSVSHFEFSGDFGPGTILNENVPFDSLIFDDPFPADKRVYVIDTARAGTDWDEWPIADGAPVDTAGNPFLVSDEDSWAVFNDADTNYHELEDTPIPGLGIEVQQSTYSFTQGTLPGAEDVFFVRWRIINHTDTAYDSAFIGLWADPDVGSAPNDYFGSDSSRDMVFAYNAQNESTPTGQQYAVGYRLLYSSQHGVGARMYSASFYLNGVDPRDPANDFERFFYLAGLDRDGSIRLASEGFVEQDGSKFYFPGNPVTGEGLRFETVFPTGRDVRMVNGLSPFTMMPGETYEVVFAAIAGEAPDRLSAVADLQIEADQIEFLFDNYIDYAMGLDTVITLSVGDRRARPDQFALHQNYPNPFNPSTMIEFELNNSGPVSLAVYNLLGQKVRVLVSGNRSAGTHRVLWDGDDEHGNLVASGVYFYRLEFGGTSKTEKMVLIR